MAFPEILKSRKVSVPCISAEDSANRYECIYKIYIEAMMLFGEALKIANDRFGIPCGYMCLKGCFDSFLIEVVCMASCEAGGSADAHITISLLKPLPKPSRNEVICQNPIFHYPDLPGLLKSIEEKYSSCCGQPPAISFIVVSI
jgi:hypothetical protein